MPGTGRINEAVRARTEQRRRPGQPARRFPRGSPARSTAPPPDGPIPTSSVSRPRPASSGCSRSTRPARSRSWIRTSRSSTARAVGSRGCSCRRCATRISRSAARTTARAGDFRVFNWDEMQINDYLYANGEVVKFWLFPRGPDSGFVAYPGQGNRWGYFDTTPLAHALGEPCYVVQPHPPGTKLVANGLPVFSLYYENDDDASPRAGQGLAIVLHRAGRRRIPGQGQGRARVPGPRVPLHADGPRAAPRLQGHARAAPTRRWVPAAPRNSRCPRSGSTASRGRSAWISPTCRRDFGSPRRS